MVRGLSLEGALSGDSPDRLVAVYLPPAYADEPDRRFPVVYLLHGFTESTERWWFGSSGYMPPIPEVLDRGVARDDVRDVIVVTPNAFNRFFGSMYASSVVVGDWETFIAEELVAFVDSHYRTLPTAASRGIVGHSMGGYGAMRIGMKRPDVFSSVYLLSAAGLRLDSTGFADDGQEKPWEGIDTDEEMAEAKFWTKVIVASSAAFAPNPRQPPLFLDLPTENGKPRPDVLARFTANLVLPQIDQYIGNLRRLKALAFDVGDKDRFTPAARELDAALERYDLGHEFEVYEGNHTNRIAERIETKVLPFFTRNLSFE